MELKDVILSTLAEMEEEGSEETLQTSQDQEPEPNLVTTEEQKVVETLEEESILDGELAYLNSIRERLLVLFEGFQAPNNANLEAKVDMTLNFLEYTLATIDSRIQLLEQGTQKR